MFNYKAELFDFCVLLHYNCKRGMIVWAILGCFLFFIRYVFLFLENCFLIKFFSNFLDDTLIIIDWKKIYGMCFFAACHFKIFLGSFLDAFLSFLCDVQYFFLTFAQIFLVLLRESKKEEKCMAYSLLLGVILRYVFLCIFVLILGTLFHVLRNSKYFQDSWYYSQNVLVLL